MSTLRVLGMLMRWSSGHVTLLREECEPFKLSPQSDIGRRADSRWALPQIFSLFLFSTMHCYSETVITPKVSRLILPLLKLKQNPMFVATRSK